MEQTQETLRVKAGTTCSLGYECVFADTSKKTITIGSYRAQDIPSSATIKSNVESVNNGIGTWGDYFTTSEGASLEKISGVTITVKAINVLIG